VIRSPKYALDTQLFIQSFRNAAANAELDHFHARYGRIEYLSAIVAQELRAGIRNDRERHALEKNVISVFERKGRSFAPSAGAWHRSGDVLAAMASSEGLELGRVSKSFANDLLLALSCREFGCVLITDNVRDFQRIQRYVPFEFATAWPSGAS